MLEVNPRLVLQVGHTETLSGLKVLHTTPLECALGAGDPAMAEMIAPYFDKFNGGEAVRNEQHARYLQHIEEMLNPEKNPPYDFTLLIKTLQSAKPEDVQAALNLDMSHDSALRDVLVQFRKDSTPGSIKIGMHFNYQHLLRAYEVYEKYNNLYYSCSDDLNKSLLFSRQVIGFIQRNLPAIDRMVFAQGLFDVIENKIRIKRSLAFKDDLVNFPTTAGDSSCLGLGFGLGFSYCSTTGGRLAGRGWCTMESCIGDSLYWKTYVEQKREACKTYAAKLRKADVSMCVVDLSISASRSPGRSI